MLSSARFRLRDCGAGAIRWCALQAVPLATIGRGSVVTVGGSKKGWSCNRAGIEREGDFALRKLNLAPHGLKATLLWHTLPTHTEPRP